MPYDMEPENNEPPQPQRPVADRPVQASAESFTLPAPAPLAPRPAPAPDARSTQALAIVKHSEEIGELFGALADAQGQFGEIERTLRAKIDSKRTGGSYTYDYAPLDEVLQAVRPALSQAGIAVLQFPFSRADVVVVRTYLGHKSGQWIYNDLTVSSLGLDPQAVGSAITYARRYALQSMLGVAPGFDDDGAAASKRDAPQAAPRRSESTQAASAPPPTPTDDTPSTIQEITERNGGALIKLANGFVCSTRDAALLEAIKDMRQRGVVVMVRTRPSSDPKRYAPVLEEIVPAASTTN